MSGALRAPRRAETTTKGLWYILCRNDLESAPIDSHSSLILSIFSSHLFHLSLVLTWVSVNLMQIAWQGSFKSWVSHTLSGSSVAAGSAHAVRDPQLGYSGIQGLSSRIVAQSGLYHWFVALGFRTNTNIMVSATLLLGSSSLLTVGAILHAMNLSYLSTLPTLASLPPTKRFILDGSSIFVNQLITGIGLTSILWSGHIIHVAAPISSGIAIKWSTLFLQLPHRSGIEPLLSLRWHEYADIITYPTGTSELKLSDIAHHHLALGTINKWECTFTPTPKTKSR